MRKAENTPFEKIISCRAEALDSTSTEQFVVFFHLEQGVIAQNSDLCGRTHYQLGSSNWRFSLQFCMLTLFPDLPGPKDKVYAVIWSPDGQKVGSGGKDKAIRIWRH